MLNFLSLRSLLLMACALHAVTQAYALSWSATEVHATGRAGEKVVAEFRFQNTSDKTVRITSVAASCDCTTPRLRQQVFAPGESGTIQAEFDTGQRRGRQEKSIVVASDDTPQSVTLKLVVDVRETIAIEPRLIVWRAGEKQTIRNVTLRSFDPAPGVEIKSVSTTDARIAAEIVPADSRDVFTIAVTSKDASTAFTAGVRIRFTVGGEEHVEEITAAVR